MIINPLDEAETANNIVKGTNKPNNSENVMGVSNLLENSETTESDVKGTNEPKTTENVPTLNNTSINQEKASVPTSGAKSTDSHHKCCPKPRGLHTRPACPRSPATASVSPKKELKSEFIMVTHGLKIPQKRMQHLPEHFQQPSSGKQTLQIYPSTCVMPWVFYGF